MKTAKIDLSSAQCNYTSQGINPIAVIIDNEGFNPDNTPCLLT